MKSGLQTTDRKQDVVIVEQPNQMPATRHSIPRWTVGVGIGIITVLAVAAVVIGAVYFGTRVTRDSYKEAWVTFKGEGMTEFVKEKIVVTNTEEDITVPGAMRIIYDFEKGMVVTQFDRQLAGTENAVCYVIEFKIPNESPLGHIMDQMNATQKTFIASTNEVIAVDQLSTRAKEMCSGCKIFRATEKTTDDVGREKRACGWGCGLQCSFGSGCRVVCGLRCTWR